MKNDAVLSSLINFLVPIIFLYGLFSLANIIDSGFFAVIYCVVLFISGFMLYLVRFSHLKYGAIVSIKMAIFFLLLLCLAYIISLLLLITDLGQI
jgi:hypothetical protein